MSEVYYKIIIDEESKELVVACLQDFDERDYDQDRFLSQFKFKTEKDAQDIIRGIYAFIGRYK